MASLAALVGMVAAREPQAHGHVVGVTVLARDAEGNALPNLEASDFTVLDNGEPRAVLSLRASDIPKGLQTRRPPTGYFISNRPLAAFPDAQPVNVIVLDHLNTEPEFRPWMASQCIRLFTLLRPGEDVAVYSLTSNGIELLHAFSGDPLHLANAIAPGGLEQRGKQFKVVPSALTGLASPPASDVDRSETEASNREARYEETWNAMAAVAADLEPLPTQRKNIFWLSSDFPVLTEQALTVLSAYHAAFYAADVRSPVVADPFQPVAPGVLDQIPKGRRRLLNKDHLRSGNLLAAATGGRLIANRNQLGEAIFDALEESRMAYELAFVVPEHKWDGKIHDLSVSAPGRRARVLTKSVFPARETPAISSAEFAEFDKTAIGLSVQPSPGRAQRKDLTLRIAIQPRDLRWSAADAKDLARASLRLEITLLRGRDASSLLSKSLDVEHQTNAADPVLENIVLHDVPQEGRLRVSVKDTVSKQAGWVTLPASLAR